MSQSLPRKELDSQLGLRPGRRVAPANLDELSQVLRDAHDQGERLLPIGEGSWPSYLGQPDATDVVVDLGDLNEIVDFTPGDLTVTVQCGLPTRELESHLMEFSLRLPGVWPGVGSVGGLLACGETSPAAGEANGTLRERILGMQVATSEGIFTRSGGKVVKNVAGYDLHRLHPGAGGGFGIITETTLRLEPHPEETATLTLTCESATAVAQAWKWLRMEGPEVAALRFELLESGAFVFVADITGDHEVVSSTERTIRTTWGHWGDCEKSPEASAGLIPPGVKLSELGLLLRLNLAPDQVLTTCVQLHETIAGDSNGVRIWAYPNLGEIRLGFPVDFPQSQEVSVVIGRGAQDGLWSYRILSQSAQTPFAPPAFSGASSQFRLLARIKEVFDPGGLLRPGAFSRERLLAAADFFEKSVEGRA